MTEQDARQMIIDFIARFRGSEHTFLHGCCYWLSYILYTRFKGSFRVDILHEPIEGHFVTRINGRLYDVRGDVSGIYQGRTLESLQQVKHEDYNRYLRLMRDCRNFVEPDAD